MPPDYDFQSEVLSRLARIEAGQSVWMEARDREIKEIKCNVADHEKRIRPLEHQYSKAIGVAAGVGIVVPLLIRFGTWLYSLIR